MKKTLALVISMTIITTGKLAFSHCEIPCGIYGDRMRVEQLREHFRTIEKSMTKIAELQQAEEINYNQLIRWVNNKELHANKVQEIVYQYFMNQRIKPVDEGEGEAYENYVKKITMLHGMLVQAMKSKQTLDLQHVEKLRGLVDNFEKAYFDEEEEPTGDTGKKTMQGHMHSH